MRLLLDGDAIIEAKWVAFFDAGDEAAARRPSQGPCIDARDRKYGRTPLSLAAANRHETVVKPLELHAAKPLNSPNPPPLGRLCRGRLGNLQEVFAERTSHPEPEVARIAPVELLRIEHATSLGVFPCSHQPQGPLRSSQ